MQYLKNIGNCIGSCFSAGEPVRQRRADGARNPSQQSGSARRADRPAGIPLNRLRTFSQRREEPPTAQGALPGEASAAPAATHIPPEDLAELLPPLIRWAEKLEAQALDMGQPLDPESLAVAERAGVVRKEDVRWLLVREIPMPKEPEYADAVGRLGMGDLNGITYGHAIFVKHDVESVDGVIAHELKHVAQFERLGMAGFLNRFAAEINQHSYRDAPLEREAIQFASEEGYSNP